MDLMEYRRRIIASSPHLSHAEGAVASFPDGTDLPLKNLMVNIDPVQDLHGQANPYPAGGSANLLKSTPYGSAYNGAVGRDLKTTTTNVMGYSVQSDGKVAINVTTAWTGRLFATDALSAGTYSFRLWAGGSNNVRATWYVTDSDLVVTELVNNQSSTGWGNVLTRTVTEGQRIALSLSSNTVATLNTEFQVNAGSNIAPIVPFENVCPISGWDAVGVHNGNTVIATISLGQTVYGGTLNPLTGVLTAYPYYASYNGETLTGRWVSDRDKYVAGTTPTIGAQVVDMSGTGTTYTLDPQTIRSLVGQNNIFADTGNVALEYWAHP